MKPTSAIAKGKELENHVAEQIRLKGLDPKAYRSHGSGNTNSEKGDIWTMNGLFASCLKTRIL